MLPGSVVERVSCVPLLRALLNSKPLRLGFIIALGVGVALFVIGWPGQFPTPYRLDLDVYRSGAQVFIDGGDVYGRLPELAQGGHLPFTYPPIAAVLFTVFAIVPLAVASAVVALASIACVALVVQLVVARTCTLSRPEMTTVVVAATAAGIWLGPFLETLVLGQVNVFLMALVLVDALLGRGRWWGGTLIGLAVAIKLTPVVFLLLLVLRRDWRSAAMAVTSFLVLTGVGHLLAPADSWKYWTATLTDAARVGHPYFRANQSINGFLHRVVAEEAMRTVLWFVIAMAVGLFIAWVAGRLLHRGHGVAATVVVGFAALLCSPISWSHHWVWVLPLLILMLVWATRPGTPTWRWLWLAVTGGAIFFIAPQWRVPQYVDAEFDWTPLQHVLGNSYVIWALVALTVVGFSAHLLGRPDTTDGDVQSAGVLERGTVLFPSIFQRPGASRSH